MCDQEYINNSVLLLQGHTIRAETMRWNQPEEPEKADQGSQSW